MVGWMCQGDSHTFVVVVPDGLGVLVPEVVVHDHVQPLGVEVHVPLGVRLQVVDMKVLSLLDDPVMVVQGGSLLQVAAARVDDCLLDRVVRGVGELLGQGEGVLGGGRVVAVPGEPYVSSRCWGLLLPQGRTGGARPLRGRGVGLGSCSHSRGSCSHPRGSCISLLLEEELPGSRRSL